MSSFIEKDKVCTGYTKTDFIVGGEMEGNALFQYAKTDGIPGVVIKGICDWGVAKNDIFSSEPEKEEAFKDSLQAFAMEKAVEKCSPLFHDKEIFSTPKNINLIHLKQQYRFCKITLIISQILIFIHGLFLLFPGFLEKYNIKLNNNPFFWVLFPLATAAIWFSWRIGKTVKNSKYYIDKEVRR